MIKGFLFLVTILTFALTIQAQDIAFTNEVKYYLGIAYVNGKPFSGDLYSSENNVNNECTCLLHATYLKGKLDGFKREYDVDGRLKSEATYKEGILQYKYKYGKPTVVSNIGELKKSIPEINPKDKVVFNPMQTKAEVYLAKAYGFYKEKDYEYALKYYLKASAEGSHPAQFKVGDIYEHYIKTDKSLDKAIKYYEMAASRGNCAAQMRLGELYQSPFLSNIKRSEEMYIKAAKSGQLEAIYRLGINYSQGKRFPLNLNLAKFWMKKAADKKYKNSIVELAGIYFKLQEYENAIHYYKTVAYSSSNGRVEYLVGSMTLDGLGTAKDKKGAKKWFKISCSNNYERACAKLKQIKNDKHSYKTNRNSRRSMPKSKIKKANLNYVPVCNQRSDVMQLNFRSVSTDKLYSVIINTPQNSNSRCENYELPNGIYTVNVYYRRTNKSAGIFQYVVKEKGNQIILQSNGRIGFKRKTLD